MTARRTMARATASMLGTLALLVPTAARAQAVNEYGNPPKLAPRPTSAAISAADLQTRIYVFADDSMQGRQTGRVGNMKGTSYIARELRRLGLEPAGENGTFFQSLPYAVRRFTPNSSLRVDGRALRWLDDFVAVPGAVAPRPLDGVQVIYGGIAGDTLRTITAEQAAGRLVILSPAPPGQGGRGGRGGRGGGGRGAAAGSLAGAAGIATVNLQALGARARAAINDPPGTLVNRPANAPVPQPAPANLRITPEAAAILLGASFDAVAPGALGGTVAADLEFVEEPVPEYGRNVVAVLRGSDPRLRGQYVAIGAHNDHVGITTTAVDHDSLRAWRSADLALQMASGDLVQTTPDQRAAIRVNLDSLRRLRAVRYDSIRNGADDDGSGSMAMLEIAEALAAAPTKPRRSIVFVWHTGEEGGLSGSRWFVENPTVPRDSIVAQINMDMIGRGRASDIPGGGDDYLAVVGSDRLSSELGAMVNEVNARQPAPFALDFRFDAETTWPGYNNIYGRSDHANYARHNIPIAFFFTGLHQDYHQVTDEPQYLDYPHYAAVTRYMHDLAVEVANRDRRPVVDRAAR